MSEEIENALKCLEMDMLDNTQIELLLNYISKLQKVIDLMAEQMSKRPLMIFQGNEKENSIEILKEPKEIIDYYTKKAEEENDNRDTD